MTSLSVLFKSFMADKMFGSKSKLTGLGADTPAPGFDDVAPVFKGGTGDRLAFTGAGCVEVVVVKLAAKPVDMSSIEPSRWLEVSKEAGSSMICVAVVFRPPGLFRLGFISDPGTDCED